MSTDNPILRGEVYWVRIPNQPNDHHQPRTAIVISPNARNAHTNDVIVIPTTSATNFRPHPEKHVHLPAGEGGLPRDSYARCDQVTTVDKSLLDLVKGPLGAPVGPTYRGKLVEAIRVAIGDARV